MSSFGYINTLKNAVVFGELNVKALAFLLLQCQFHNILRKQNGRRKNLNFLQLKEARKTHSP